MENLRIEELTIEQKIGQLICVRGYINEEDKKFILEMVKEKKVGAVQMSFREGYREFINEVRSIADYPVMIFLDIKRKRK